MARSLLHLEEEPKSELKLRILDASASWCAKYRASRRLSPNGEEDPKTNDRRRAGAIEEGMNRFV